MRTNEQTRQAIVRGLRRAGVRRPLATPARAALSSAALNAALARGLRRAYR